MISPDSVQLASVPVLDEDQIKLLETSVAGDRAFLKDLLDTFVYESQLRLKSLEEHLRTADKKTALQDIHFMAGSAASIGLNRFSFFCRKVEEQLRGGFSLSSELPGRAAAYHSEGVRTLRERWG